MNKIKKELEQLEEAKIMIETETFQKFFVKPIKKLMDDKAIQFFAEDLKENWRTGGQVEGLNEFLNILKEINTDYKNKKFEFENLPEVKKRP